jgi:DnaJ-class molecular chaperone
MTTLILAIAIGTPLYAAFCLIRPTKSCRRCGGWGTKPGRRRRATRRHCSRCDGTGRRFRVPARIAYRIRGANRRHAELTLRAAVRTAEAGAEASQEREQAQS